MAQRFKLVNGKKVPLIKVEIAPKHFTYKTKEEVKRAKAKRR